MMPNLIFKSVESSNIDSIAYDNINLYIKFKSGRLYIYYNVPVNIYEQLMNSESKGKFFHKFIKSNYLYDEL